MRLHTPIENESVWRSTTTAEFLKNMKVIDSSPGVIESPWRTHDVLITDLREIIHQYSPTARIAWFGYKDPILRDFVKKFSVQNIIAAEFVNHYDCPREDSIWTAVEYHFPDGTGAFGESQDAMEGFQLLSELVAEDVFKHLTRRAEMNRLRTDPMDLLMDKWVTPHAACFVDRNFDPTLEKFGERFGKL